LFSVVKAVLLNPLPYPDSNRLVWVAAILDGNESRTSMPDFDDYKAGSRAFDAIAAYSEAPLVAGGGEAPERITGTMVTEDFFDLLGVQPALSAARSTRTNTGRSQLHRRHQPRLVAADDGGDPEYPRPLHHCPGIPVDGHRRDARRLRLPQPPSCGVGPRDQRRQPANGAQPLRSGGSVLVSPRTRRTQTSAPSPGD
jgi:hypothetical protein